MDVMRLLTGKWIPPVIGVLAELNVADHLAAGPRTADELAREVGAHPDALRRLLRAAASAGVFTDEGDGRFALNAAAEQLRGLREAAMMFALEPFWTPYAHIKHSALTGEPAFPRAYGMSVYEYLSAHPETMAVFGAAAAGFHAQAVTAIADAHDWSRHDTVVDVGGGSGTLLAAILDRHPGVHGVLFDRPDVVAAADGPFERVGGDFFASVPPGDAMVIKSCLHNFGDDQAIALLQVLRRALPPDGTLLVAETIVPSGPGEHYAKLDDIEMLVIAGGRDRDEDEYARLLAAGGFTTGRITPCGDRFSLIEARLAAQPLAATSSTSARNVRTGTPVPPLVQ